MVLTPMKEPALFCSEQAAVDQWLLNNAQAEPTGVVKPAGNDQPNDGDSPIVSKALINIAVGHRCGVLGWFEQREQAATLPKQRLWRASKGR